MSDERPIRSVDDLVRLYTGGGTQEEFQQARWAELPVEVWFELIERFPEHRLIIQDQKRVPVDVLEALADDPAVQVREAVAEKKQLPLHLYDKLARDPHHQVREGIAAKVDRAPWLRERLANDPSYMVRRIVQHEKYEKKSESS
ncbi:MAG TPA: hypothetical protein VF053_10170 [Streptosporangiales bacterium]